MPKPKGITMQTIDFSHMALDDDIQQKYATPMKAIPLK